MDGKYQQRLELPGCAFRSFFLCPFRIRSWKKWIHKNNLKEKTNRRQTPKETWVVFRCFFVKSYKQTTKQSWWWGGVRGVLCPPSQTKKSTTRIHGGEAPRRSYHQSHQSFSPRWKDWHRHGPTTWLPTESWWGWLGKLRKPGTPMTSIFEGQHPKTRSTFHPKQGAPFGFQEY